MASPERDAAFEEWLLTHYGDVTANVTAGVPANAGTNADPVTARLIARAAGAYEIVFLPSFLHPRAQHRKNEILAGLVLGICRAHGVDLGDKATAAATVARLVAESSDTTRVKTSLGAAGALVAPLLSPDIGLKAWRVLRRTPTWGKVAVGTTLAVGLAATPMLRPLALGLLARDHCRRALAPPTTFALPDHDSGAGVDVA